MNNKERDIDDETDLYEEILTYESLDQYEGLLNYYSNNKKDKKKASRKSFMKKKRNLWARDKVIVSLNQDPPLIAKTFIPFDCKYIAPHKPITFRPITKAQTVHGVFFCSSIISISKS